MKIAIVGSGPTGELAPFGDESWSMWTLAFRDAPRSDAMFEMHARPKWVFHTADGYIEKLARASMPIYTLEPHGDIPHCVVYPLADVKASLAPAGAEADFFTSSLAYMLALAIFFAFSGTEPVEEIGLFGADMCAEDEYAYQRPAMSYLVALARGRGVKVTLPPNSPLLRAHFTYGEHLGDHAFPQATGVTADVLGRRLARYQKDRAETEVRLNETIARMNTLDGCIAEVRALIEAVRHFNRGGVIADA